jgi:hypothetical protein
LGRRRQITTALIVLGALGTLFVWTIPLLAMLQSPNQSDSTTLLFIQRSELAAFSWLRANSSPEDVVLASARVGMFIPGQTGRRVFYGHPFETLRAKQRLAQVEAFYRGETAEVPAEVKYIIYGPSEQKLGQPALLSSLPLVFSENNVSIYEVKR